MKASERYKMAQRKDEVTLYPYPVNKEKKHLIVVRDSWEARIALYCLNAGALADPLSDQRSYEELAQHLDGQTPRFRILPDKWQLVFLPQRKLDEAKAAIIEGLIAKKVAQLFLHKKDARKIMADLQYRFKKQQECSECQKLGILDTELETWIAGFSQFGGDHG